MGTIMKLGGGLSPNAPKSIDLPTLIEYLEQTPSPKVKMEILEKTKGDEELTKQAKYFFKMCLDSHIKFHVKKYQTEINPSGIDDFSTEAVQVLAALADRKLTGKAAVLAVEKAIHTMSPRWANLYSRILSKDPKCGLSTISLKKLYPDLFSEGAKLCKAVSYSAASVEKNIQFPAYSQVKVDGARCLMFCEGEERDATTIRLESSGFKQFFGLTGIEEYAKKAFYANKVIDGEIIFVDENENPLPRKVSNGLANKAVAGTISPEEAAKARYIVWDILTFKEYETEKTHGYKARLGTLLTFLGNTKQFYPDEKPTIIPVETVEVDTVEDALEHFRQCITRGEEGTILKNINFTWSGKRIKDCQKFKLEISSTLKVVDIQKGKANSKYKDCMGALVCETEDKKVRVGVGSGFSDDERMLFSNPDVIVGKCIEVVHNGIITTGKSTSLFLPRYVGTRFDKTEADTIEVIEANSLTTSQLKEEVEQEPEEAKSVPTPEGEKTKKSEAKPVPKKPKKEKVFKQIRTLDDF